MQKDSMHKTARVNSLSNHQRNFFNRTKRDHLEEQANNFRIKSAASRNSKRLTNNGRKASIISE